MASINKDSYLKLLASSGIADPKSLEKAQALASESNDSKDLAVRMIREGILTSWQAKYLLTGRSRLKLGKYTLQERLDRAQFGDRFVAVHQRLDRKVELQLLRAELCENKSALDRFLEQSRKAAELDHPNLVHVYDIDQEADRFFLVVEHADGVSLDRDANAAEICLTEMASHLGHVAEGIQHAHGHGVVHGQVARANMLLTQVDSDNGHSASNQLMLGNIAMATLVQELEEAPDESIRIGKTECDDWVAFGQVGLELVDLAQTDVDDTQRRRLKTILSGFVKLREPSLNQIETLQANLKSWTDSHRPSSPDIAGENSNHLENNSGRELANSDSPKEAGAQKVLKQSTDPQTETQDSNSGGRSILPFVIIGVLAAGFFFMVAAGAVGYFVFFRGASNKSDVAYVDNRKKAEPNRIFSDLPDSPLNNDSKEKGTDQTKKKQDEKQKQNPDQPINTDKTVPKPNGNDGWGPNGTKGDTKKGDDKKNVAKKEDTNKDVAKKNDVAKKDPGKKTQPKTAKPGDDKKNVAKKDVKKAPQLAPPFKGMPVSVGLPSIEDGVKEQMLGKVVCGKRHLLGMTLLFKEGLAPKAVSFALERGSGSDNQKWTVKIVRKTKSAPIAEFWKVGDDLKFRWLEDAAKERSAGYFQNCVVRLETRETVQFVKLRKPIALGELIVDKKKNEIKKTLVVDYLPPQGVIYEVMKPEPADYQKISQLVFSPQNRRVGVAGQPIFAFPTKVASARAFWLRIDVRIAKKIQIESRYQVAAAFSDQRGRNFNPKTLQRLLSEGQRMSQLYSTQLEQLRAYQPQEGEKLEHGRQVNAATQKLTSVRRATAEIQRLIPQAEKMYELPIRFRIFFDVEGHTVDIATVDGKPFVLK